MAYTEQDVEYVALAYHHYAADLAPDQERSRWEDLAPESRTLMRDEVRRLLED